MTARRAAIDQWKTPQKMDVQSLIKLIARLFVLSLSEILVRQFNTQGSLIELLSSISQISKLLYDNCPGTFLSYDSIE